MGIMAIQMLVREDVVGKRLEGEDYVEYLDKLSVRERLEVIFRELDAQVKIVGFEGWYHKGYDVALGYLIEILREEKGSNLKNLVEVLEDVHREVIELTGHVGMWDEEAVMKSYQKLSEYNEKYIEDAAVYTEEIDKLVKKLPGG